MTTATNSLSKFSADEMETFKVYLNGLRESGQCNMFGAAVYLEGEFNLSSKDARDVLVKWMKDFG